MKAGEKIGRREFYRAVIATIERRTTMKVEFEGGSVKAAEKRKQDIVAEAVEPATADWVDQAAAQMSTPPAEREFNYAVLPANHAKLASEAATAIKTSAKRIQG